MLLFFSIFSIQMCPSLSSIAGAIPYQIVLVLTGGMSLYDGLSVETAPIPEISEKVVDEDEKPESSKNLSW